MSTRTRVTAAVLAVLVLVAVAVAAVLVLRHDDRTLSNGCTYSARGIPACGAYVGAAIGANDEPAELETALGGRLGVHRTYWQQGQTGLAVETARADVEAGRLPWISFKLGVSWQQAGDGEADAWAKDLARQLGGLPGPVWVAIHHEPENDGDIAQWRAMQERLGPLLRTASNVGFTVVLTGWNQFHGPPEYSLDRIWPDTKVDVAGFDIYNTYGPRENGTFSTATNDLRTEYFAPISAWAKQRGIAWGLGETGLTDQAAEVDPTWISTTYRDLVDTGGIAFVYFDSENFITRPIDLSMPQKKREFASILRSSPRLPVPR